MGAFTDKLRTFFGLRKAVSAELFDDLCDLLVEGDFGAHEAYTLTEKLQEACKKEKITESDAVRRRLAVLLEDMLRTSSLRSFQDGAFDESALDNSDTALTIILLLGVNGVGKTTTAAKLGARYSARYMGQTSGHSAPCKPVLAAADTFRAAAIDQLKIHGERLGLRVVAHQRGGNPAAVIYDAIEASGGKGLIIADTAGRMHTKAALVEELKKIDRVVESKAAGANYLKWLVLDATTGRNALAQAGSFKEAVAVNGVILTKYDSSARGGAVFSLAADMKLPVLFVCNGEKYEDIAPFNAKNYAEEFVGIA